MRRLILTMAVGFPTADEQLSEAAFNEYGRSKEYSPGLLPLFLERLQGLLHFIQLF